MNPMYITFAIYLIAVLLIVWPRISPRAISMIIFWAGAAWVRLLRRCRRVRPICRAGF